MTVSLLSLKRYVHISSVSESRHHRFQLCLGLHVLALVVGLAHSHVSIATGPWSLGVLVILHPFVLLLVLPQVQGIRLSYIVRYLSSLLLQEHWRDVRGTRKKRQIKKERASAPKQRFHQMYWMRERGNASSNFWNEAWNPLGFHSVVDVVWGFYSSRVHLKVGRSTRCENTTPLRTFRRTSCRL